MRSTLITKIRIFTKDGARGYLIGESFMRQDDIAGAVRELCK